MKLSIRILLTLFMSLVPLMLLWGTLFYFAMVSEINEEADDSLERYASLIVERCREGRVLPALNSGSNNSYTLRPITAEEAAEYRVPHFRDEEVYIPERREWEPARVMTLSFLDDRSQYLLLEVATPTFEKDDLVETILGWSVALFALLIVVVVVVATLSIRSTLQPLYALLKWLDGYTPGQRHSRVPNDTDITELRRLNEAAQSAVERSESMVERQKQFIGNASHELQTPLAVVSNRVEHLINYTAPTEEQLAELVEISNSLRQSVRLNRTLLQLTRIESGEVAQSEDVDVVAVVEEVVDTCREIYAEREIECQTVLPESYTISINEGLLRTLVLNIVKNAFVHGMERSCVEVSLERGVLRISNAGDAALDGERLYDRFYTSGSRETSTGLGLAIVKSICDHYGYALYYKFVDSKHHFEVHLR